MPVDEHLMASLKARYGDKRGESVYYAMEGEGKGPFGPKGKLHAQHEAFVEKHHWGEAPGTAKKPPKAKRPKGSKKPPPYGHKVRKTGAPKR